MKPLYLFLIFLLTSCTKNNIEAHVYDYDTSKPIQNVEVFINGNKTQTDSTGYFSMNVNCNNCVVLLNKKDYARKEVLRKQGNEVSSSKSDIIYLYKKDSDFSLKE